jgi:hypothetical protein
MQIETTIQDVEHDQSTGWYTILTSDGKFSTKHREPASDALRLRGKLVLLDYNEQVVNKPAPDGSGMRTYRNRYFNRAGELPAPSANDGGFTMTGEQTATGDTPRMREDPERSWRICLQTGGKLALATLPLMPNEQRTFETQKQIALAWAKFFYFTPPPSAAELLGPRPPTPQQAYGDVPAFAGGGYEAGGHESESSQSDDIPW